MIPIIHTNLTCYYSEQKIARGPRVSSQDESRPFGRSNPSASRLKSLPKAVVVDVVDVGRERGDRGGIVWWFLF